MPETNSASPLYHLGACENSFSQVPFLYVRFAWRASSNRRDRRPRRSVYILYHKQFWYAVSHSTNLFISFPCGVGGLWSGFPEASRAELWGVMRRWIRRASPIGRGAEEQGGKGCIRCRHVNNDFFIHPPHLLRRSSPKGRASRREKELAEPNFCKLPNNSAPKANLPHRRWRSLITFSEAGDIFRPRYRSG